MEHFKYDYFGMRYELSNDSKIAWLISAINAKGRVFVPKSVMYNGQEYEVTYLQSKSAYMLTQPNDKRIKDKSKFPEESIGRYGPFTKHYEYGMNLDEALPPNTTVTYVKLPETIRSLEQGAFRRCYALEEVELPKNIKRIAYDCFSECISLKSIQLHEGITEIGDDAFRGCTAMKEITIPSTVSKIGSNAFGDTYRNKSGLEVVNILNDEGAVLMYPDSFTDRVKINYLGKPKTKAVPAAKKEVAPKKSEKAATEAKPDKKVPKETLKPKPADKDKPTKDALKVKIEPKPTAKTKPAPAGDFKKSATAKGYTIGIKADSKVVVSKGGTVCDNTMAVLREIAKAVGFTIEVKWNTQQTGSKLVDFLNKQ